MKAFTNKSVFLDTKQRCIKLVSLVGDSIDLVCRPKGPQVLICYDFKVRHVFGHAYKLCTKKTWTYIMNDSMFASINTATLVA